MADEAVAAAKKSIFEGIAKAAEALEKHQGPAQAAGLKDLAEAYAWLNYPNQPH